MVFGRILKYFKVTEPKKEEYLSRCEDMIEQIDALDQYWKDHNNHKDEGLDYFPHRRFYRSEKLRLCKEIIQTLQDQIDKINQIE